MGLEWWLGAGIVAAVGAMAAGTAGAIDQHEQGKANAEAQANMAEWNKRQALRDAEIREQETMEAARQQRLQAEDMKSRQRAMLGKSGAAMTSGSPLAILGATALEEERAVQTTHLTGYREASGLRNQAKQYDYSAAVARLNRPSSLSLGVNIANSVLDNTKYIAGLGMQYESLKGK